MNCPSQRTEKLSTGTGAPGPPSPQSLLIVVSQRVSRGLPARAMPEKYRASNWPAEQEAGESEYVAVYVVAVAGAVMLWVWAPPSDQEANA